MAGLFRIIGDSGNGYGGERGFCSCFLCGVGFIFFLGCAFVNGYIFGSHVGFAVVGQGRSVYGVGGQFLPTWAVSSVKCMPSARSSAFRASAR